MDLSKSMQMQERAKKNIPGMTQLLSKRPDMFSMGVWPGYYKKAKGAEVWDMDGNKYLDMSISGIGANILGYADDDVDSAVRDAISEGTSCSLNCYEEVELAELLCDIHPWAENVRFTRSGGEAMAVAVRIARASTDKEKIAFCGYHGWHDWYLSANIGTENALGEHLISGLNPAGVPRSLEKTAFPFRFNRIDDLEEIVNKVGNDLAAIVMEPIRNFDPDPQFFKRVREIADRTGSILILDEISAAFRLNLGGAHLSLYDQTPDIAVFSKAIGNGYPISAIIGKEAIMSAAQKTFISSTNWTERIGPVAAIATIKKYRQLNAHIHLNSIGNMIQTGWNVLSKKHGLPIIVSGLKAMGHFNFESDNAQEMKAFFIQLMLDEGFLASNLFYAMHAHTEEHVDRYLNAVDKTFHEISKCHSTGTITGQLKGKPSQTGFKRLT